MVIGGYQGRLGSARVVGSRIQSETHSRSMETEILSVEFISLFRATHVLGKSSADDSPKRRKARQTQSVTKSARTTSLSPAFRHRGTPKHRPRLSSSNSIVFRSPRFTLARRESPKVFDECASDQDEATVVPVVESFNPYTSLESGSYSGSQYVLDLAPYLDNKAQFPHFFLQHSFM